MGEIIDCRDMSNWIIGVESVSFEIPEYEDIPSFCDIVGMKEYDLTKVKDEAEMFNMLWDMSVLLEESELRCDKLELRLYRLEHPEG